MIRHRNKRKKTPKYFYVAALGIFLFLGIGYSVITTTLEIKGNVTASANKWDIYFENVEYAEDSKKDAEITVTNGSQMTFNINLNNPGEKYEFTFDVTNNGTLDALIKTAEITTLTEEQQKYINYSVEYDEGLGIEENDLLEKKSSRKIRVLVEYKKLIATDLYPEDNINIDFKLNLNYYQPKEETYILKLIDNNSNTTEYDIKNSQQQLKIDATNINVDNAIITCTNNAIPTTDEEGNLIIKNIKKETVCVTSNTLKNVIEAGFNISKDITDMNITMLKDIDDSTNLCATIPSGKSITFDLNGKKYISTFGFDTTIDETPVIKNNGTLKIKDSKDNGTLQTNYRLISSYGYLDIESGNYIRKNTESSSDNGGIFGLFNGTANLKNSSFKTDNTWAIFTLGDASVSIDNCDVESTGQTSTICAYTEEETIASIKIKNSTIKNSLDRTISALGKSKTEYYICNSTLIAPNNDYYFDNSTSRMYYSDNSVFRDGTNNPSTNSTNRNTFKTDDACAE